MILTVAPAGAAVTLVAENVGTDLVVSGGGTLNLTALTQDPGFFLTQAALNGDLSLVTIGSPGFEFSDLYTGVTVPPPFGPAVTFTPDFGSGDKFGSTPGSGPSPALVVPDGYVSGDPLAATMTFVGESVESLNLIPGTYTWTWGAGPDADLMTLVIVPEPSGAVLLGLASLAVLGRRRPRAEGRP
ncbi:MAG: PEP-CTERM sorting domain-containing protein [Akkermansiaceae bacterium]|nr:PEP-CTERM sorting domain-containing protein [Akkermansiaceae bacterium]